MSTVQEIKAAIDTLSSDEREELERLLGESKQPFDPEVDSPELEAELLRAADGPFTPYSRKDLEAVAEQSTWF